MKAMFLFIFTLFPLITFSNTYISKISFIDESVNESPHLIMLENGVVIFLNKNEKEEIKFFKNTKSLADVVEIKTDNENNFISASTITKFNDFEEPQSFFEIEKGNNISYEPTLLNSVNEATAIFRRMRRDYQNESQCYNRAHIWTWEEYNRSKLRSKKYFLFFTTRYIRAYRYHWWFHVTPAVSINGLGDRMLDRRYTTEIKSIKDWTDKFIYSKRNCPVVFKYNEYRNNQYSEHCYLIPVSMFFWQPRDIERRDSLGIEKTNFIKREVGYAYWEAF